MTQPPPFEVYNYIVLFDYAGLIGEEDVEELNADKRVEAPLPLFWRGRWRVRPKCPIELKNDERSVATKLHSSTGDGLIKNNT
jgi:hypothetical protein